MEKFRITLNGVCHEVEVERISSGRPQADKQQSVASVPVVSSEKMEVSAMEPELRPVIGEGEKISAPMPGKVLSVEVAEGQTVKRGDNLLILEAMKMQNEIKAPRDGVIISLFITAGKAVTSGEVLLTLE
jgi:Acetyl/propionyl-CoA carboxylase, alpha subunit